MDEEKLVDTLKSGGIGVIPTDTLYGIVASALHKDAVEKVYSIKERSPEKAVIILVSDSKDLTDIFDISLSESQERILKQYWPGKISFILPCQNETFSHLHRGLGSLAFRVPENTGLRSLLSKTGPLIAPSANREGEAPARTIEQAKLYFGDQVDVYVDKGELVSEASTIVSLLGDTPEIIRQGAVKMV